MTQKIHYRRSLALAEALLVTFLWSTSYVLIKIGLIELNPIAFATYRYLLASSILVMLMVTRYKSGDHSVLRKHLLLFLLLGFTGYFIAQGLQFFGLYYLPAITVTFILNMTPLCVLILSIVFLNERPTTLQLAGIIIVFVGVVTFFSASTLVFTEVIGVILTAISGVGWATHMIISRHYLRSSKLDAFEISTYPMFLGSLMLVGATFASGNIVQPSMNSWLIILWLSIVNTAVAFVLWNHALRVLRAYEQSILQNTMLIQITLLAYIFLGETLTIQKVTGIMSVFTGVLIVQLASENKP